MAFSIKSITLYCQQAFKTSRCWKRKQELDISLLLLQCTNFKCHTLQVVVFCGQANFITSFSSIRNTKIWVGCSVKMLLFKLTYLQLPMLVMVTVGFFYPSASSEWTFIVPSFLFSWSVVSAHPVIQSLYSWTVHQHQNCLLQNQNRECPYRSSALVS